MQSQLPMHRAKRCLAKTRRKTLCQSPAMPNGQCRMHGGKSPGAPTGERNGNYRNGMYTKEAIANRLYVRELVKQAMGLAGGVIKMGSSLSR
jgi:hypothetical protein